MALNVGTGGTLGATAPSAGVFDNHHGYYVREFIEVAQPEMVYDMFGKTKVIPANSSNRIVHSKLLNMATLESSPLSEGVTPTEQQLQMVRVEKDINQYGGFATVTDRLISESIDGLTSEFNTRLAEQGGKTMNKVCRNDLVAGSNVRYKGGVANRDFITASGVLAADFDFMFKALKSEFVKPIRAMSNGSANIGTAPTRESYPVLIPVEAAGLVETLDDSNGNTFKNAENYASQKTLWTNEYGSFKQFAFILDTEGITVTNDVSAEGGGGADQDISKSLVFGKDAYETTTIGSSDVEVIIKGLGTGGTGDPLNQRSTIGWKAKKGCVITQQTYMFRYEFSLGDA